nr:hypothetical protein [Candidatus Freyarchaeota archaeon]
MSDLKISDFKMFDKAPYELPDPRTQTGLAIKAAKEVEKTYGPVFSLRFIKHALWFIAQKTGEKTPQNIKTLDQLEEYLVSISNKYPTPYCATTYAQVKTENELQGQTGAGTRVEAMSISRNVVKVQESEVKDFDADDALLKGREIGVAMKILPSEMGYKKNEDGSVDIIFPKCPFMDGCELAFEEVLLKRPDGRTRCIIGEGVCQYFKIFSGHEWDYDLLEFDKPHCINRCYIL